MVIGIKESMEKFIESSTVSNLAPSSKATYNYALVNFTAYLNKINGVNSIDSVDDITAKVLGNYTEYLERNGKSISTIRQYLTVVKIWLYSTSKQIQFSYKAPAGSRKKQQTKQTERMFTEVEVEMILGYEFKNGNALRDTIMVRLLFETGARIQELSKIKWEDVNLMERMIWLGTSKTVPRPAFCSSETNGLLSKYKASSFYFEGDADGKDDWEKELFPEVAHCKKIFTDMLVELGLKNGADGRGPHTARHYTATYLYYVGGMDGNDVAKLLGDKWETIRDVYLHPTPKMLKARVDKAMGW